MKVLIDSSESNTIHKIKEEEKRVSSEFDSAYHILLKKRNEIQILKDELELNLAEKDKFEFVEVGVEDHATEYFLSSQSWDWRRH